MVQRNKTAFHPNLDPQETLGSILTVKLTLIGDKIHEMDIPNDILTRAKKVAWEYNKAHKYLSVTVILPFVFEAKRNFAFCSLFFCVNF